MKLENNENDKEGQILIFLKANNPDVDKIERLRLYYEKYRTLDYFEKNEDKNVINILIKLKEEIEYDKKIREEMKQIILHPKEDKLHQKPFLRSLMDDPELNDLIQTALPIDYNHKTDSIVINELASDLMKLRTYEMDYTRKQEEAINEKEYKFRTIKQTDYDESNKFNKPKMLFDLQAKKKAIGMPNDKFKLLLCLMKKKKAKEYEKNPYVMNYRITLNTIYNSNISLNDDEDEENNDNNSIEARNTEIAEHKTLSTSLMTDFIEDLDEFSKDLIN